MSKVNENKRHWKILSRYSFVAEDERGDYDNGKPREGCLNSNGYVCHPYMCEDGKWHTITEHIAKWEVLIGEVPDGFELDHIDGNPLNNRISNLRVVDHRANMLNPSTFSKRIGMFKGEKHPMYGRKQTEESKEKNRLSHIGKPNIARSKQLIQVKDDGTVIEWSSTMECGRNGYNSNAVGAACRGNYNKEGNHRYKDSFWYYK